MTNALYDSALIDKSAPDAPMGPRLAAWGLDLAVEIAFPYLIAVFGYVSFQGIRSLVNRQSFDLGSSLANTLFPENLWNTFKELDNVTTPNLDQGITFGALGSLANSEFLYVLPLTLVLMVVFFIINRLMLPVLSGQTLGKRLMGLKIVTLKGELPGLGNLFLRHVPGQLLSSFFFLGYIFAWISPEHRGWHDYIGGTKVIQEADYVPEFQRDGAISSALLHLEVFVLAVFFVYFFELLILLLRLLGVPLPAFLLPPPPIPSTPIEFVVDSAQTPKTQSKPNPTVKRFASAKSVAGGVRDPKRRTEAGSPGQRQEPKPAPVQPRPQATPKQASAQPVDPPKKVAPDPQPTQSEPSPVAATSPVRQKRTTTRDLGDLASNPEPSPRVKRASSQLGGPLTLDNSRSGSGPGGRGDSPLFNPDRTGNGPSGIDSEGDADFGPYLNKLQKRVKRQWLTPTNANSRRTVLNFTLDRQGRLIKLDLVRSSGNQDTDQAAMDAVRRAAPFDPLPSDYRGTNVDIKFTFDINVFGGGVDDGRGY